ncbi:AMP-dependent synthetase/ligase, partial [Comamonas sp.]
MTTTFPHLLQKHAAERPGAPALREKEYGIWQTWSWQEVAQEVRHFACGLKTLGFTRGNNLALISDNRPHVYMGFVAVQSLGGVPIPLYQDAVAAEMVFVLQDADISYAFAENQEQVDKLLEIRESVPGIQHIIYDDPRGLRHYDQPGLISTAELIARGAQWDAANPGAWETGLSQVQPDDVSVILYTSGTTGKPKGVCQTHASFAQSAMGGVQVDGLNADDNVISYLPPAWVGDHLFSLAQWLVAGFTINCPESAATVSIDLREIGPTYYFAPPRIFEGMLTSVSIRMEDAAAPKRWLFERCMQLARRVGSDILDGKPVGFMDRMLYRLGDFAIYGPLRNVMGLSHIRVAYTAGAAIGPDLFRFFRSIGINLKQLYGQTETCAYVCIQHNGQVKLHTVGQAAPGIELKLADNGEVLVRGVSVLKEYYKRPDATAEAIDEQGFFHTGDAGVIDADGHLRIIDRAKDVGKTNAGAMFAPNYIENKLKFFSHIKEAVCFGH